MRNPMAGCRPGQILGKLTRMRAWRWTKKLNAVPAFGNYLDKCTRAIVQKPVKRRGVPAGAVIVARFKLHESGIVSEIETATEQGNILTVSGSTNNPAARSVVKNIKRCSPFPPWPDGMRSAAGKPYLEIYIHVQIGIANAIPNCGESEKPEPGCRPAKL
jgi:hypothetical protein